MTYTATYSPDDNKIRLYASTRLDAETYARVKAAGFSWAPKQELFVAPMWTPEREDLALELAGEIDDEDKSLVERAEERAERFEDYSDARRQDADRAHAAVHAIADNIPLGQPILVGHHSERHARKDAERIENGMRRAVKMWDTAQYWKSRAAGAIRAAKYKELPAVRARRIKGLEADRRKQEKYRSEAEMWLKLWTECANEQDKELQLGVARKIANMCWLYLPHKEGDKPGWDQCPTASDALSGENGANYYPSLYAPRTLQEIFDAAQAAYPRQIARAERWINHIDNRLTYERAMLEDAGGTVADRNKPEVGGAVRCWCSPGYGKGWSYIRKVNKVSVTLLDNWGNGGSNFTRTIPFDKLKAVISRAEVEEKRAAGLLLESDDKTGFYFRETPEQTRPETQQEAAERVHRDAIAAKEEPKPAAFDAMRETLKAGVQVVTAPQLFPTPADLAARMVEAAEIQPDDRVLEPSAGTGNILKAIGNQPDKVAVEINPRLVEVLARCGVSGLHIQQGDFLEQNGNLGKFDRILMNPPFENGADIKHIEHALSFLKPGGKLVAICANGPRQNERLKPMVERLHGTWEPLPADTFKESGTRVNAVLLTI